MIDTREVTVRGRQIGATLRVLREECGLTAEQAADRIHVSKTTLCRIENGRGIPRYDDVVGLLVLYRASSEERRDLLALAREAGRTGWWQKTSVPLYERIHTLRTLEWMADSITNYEPEVIPGLLQTVPYMQAMMREMAKMSDEDMVDRVAARFQRQQVLRRQPRPRYLAIITESALHQGIGGPEVMHGQLAYLLEAAAKSYITIRVVPNSIGGHAGLAGSFVRLCFADRSDVMMEEMRSSNIFLEDRADLAYYDQAEPDLLAVALDESLSLELIASAARDRDEEAGWHGLSQPDHTELA